MHTAWKKVAISVAILSIIAIGIAIAYATGWIGGRKLPSPAPGVQRMPITWDREGRPAADAPSLTFTRKDGVAVTVFLDRWSHPDFGQPAFIAYVGPNPDTQRTGSTVITVGQSAVLDGVRVTVVADWTGSKYRSDAVDVRLTDGGH